MRKKIVSIMFLGCFSSPVLLGVFRGKEVVFPNITDGSSLGIILVLYLPVLFVLAGFTLSKTNEVVALEYTYGIITVCIGVFLSFMFSWWYILLSVYAFVFLVLMVIENMDNASH